MSKETYIEIRENMKYIYGVVNNIINSYEKQKTTMTQDQKDIFFSESVLKLGDVSSILQIDIHRLDIILSIQNINNKVNYKTQ